MRGLVADPVVLVLALMLVGSVALRFRRGVGVALMVVGMVALYALSTPAVSGRLLAAAENGTAPVTVGQEQRAIVVLAAGMRRHAPEYGVDGTLNAWTLERARYAARLHDRTGLPILVSGGLPPGFEKSSAAAMRSVLEDEFNVDVRWVEDRSRNTEEQASRSAAILSEDGVGSIYLVTHAAHMPRARESFERAGFDVTAAPTVFTSPGTETTWYNFVPRTTSLIESWYALHEIVGRVWYEVAYAE